MTAPRPRHFAPLARRGIGVVVLGVILVATVLLHVLVGPGDIDVRTLVDILLGGGDRAARMVVLDWRLPRALLAVLIGSALAISGLLVQTLAANDLGSPDLLGLTVGAHTGVLVAAAIAGGSTLAQFGGALAGTVGVAAVVLLLVRGRIDGPRLVVAGVGVGTAVGALNVWLMLRAQRDLAMSVAAWSAGTLNDATASQVVVMAAVTIAAALALLVLARPIHTLELGPEVASALGVRVGTITAGAFGLAVLLVAMATAITGPIAFIALAAPHIARATAPGTVGYLRTALTGAALLAVADFLAKLTLIPVGLVTLAAGGLYLTALLLRNPRRERSPRTRKTAV